MIKNNIKCPKCDTTNAKDSQFCSKCGFDMNTKTTKLGMILLKHDIPIYQIAQHFGKNPATFGGLYRKKVEGETKMTKEEYVEILKFLKQKTGIELTQKDVPFDIEWIRVK